MSNKSNTRRETIYKKAEEVIQPRCDSMDSQFLARLNTVGFLTISASSLIFVARGYYFLLPSNVTHLQSNTSLDARIMLFKNL